jgi:pimeloyl-ACP methyl ester carboxylesterase
MIAELNDIKMNYEEYGQGKPVVLLHGLALDSSTWDEVVKLYSDQARFIVPDLRGHGKTNTGDVNGSIEQYADDLFAFVNFMRLESFTLVGHSMGGYIALVFAEKYPQRLKSLVMVTSNARSDTPEKRELRFEEAELALESGMHAIADPMVQKLTTQPGIRQQVIPIIENNDPRGFANVQHAIASRTNRLDQLKNLDIPLLAIAGSDDLLMKPEVTFEMAEASRSGKALVLPRIGHLPMLEEPLALGALIVNML